MNNCNSKIQRLSILKDDIPFDRITMREVVDVIICWARRHSEKRLVVNMNAAGVVEYISNPSYARIIRRGDLIYSDGWGPVVAARLWGKPLSGRVNVGDYIYSLIERMEKHHLSLFLIGCESGVAAHAAQEIRIHYPKLRISGYSSGFLSEEESIDLIRRLEQESPKIVLIGMGIPFQEKWLEKYWGELPNAIYIGVGGVFYYLSGVKSRAPRSLRDCGFEWLYRLLQEPKRLGRRYTVGNLFFIYYVIQSLLRKFFNPQ